MEFLKVMKEMVVRMDAERKADREKMLEKTDANLAKMDTNQKEMKE
jgi:hypothetical protein